MNDDTFRRQHRELTWHETNIIDTLESDATFLLATLQSLPDGREKSLAITKLEECVMWATKGISK